MTGLKKRLSESDFKNSLLPFVLVALALIVAIVGRLTPHAANMTPMFAIAMAVGAWLGCERQFLSGIMVMVAMLVSDYFLGFHSTMIFVYVGMLLGVLIAARSVNWLSQSRNTFSRVVKSASTSLFASAVFFAISNFGVWVMGGLYPRSLDGLIQCYVMAVPFFQQSLLTDVVFGTVFLYSIDLARRSFPLASWIVTVEGGTRNAR